MNIRRNSSHKMPAQVVAQTMGSLHADAFPLCPSPAPPDPPGSLLLRLMGRLSLSSATSRKKGVLLGLWVLSSRTHTHTSPTHPMYSGHRR